METLTSNVTDKYIDVLAELNINTNTALNEYLILNISNKITLYAEECNFFEQKYKTNFEEFELKVNNPELEENYTQWDDYIVWKFAFESRKYYLRKIVEIK